MQKMFALTRLNRLSLLLAFLILAAPVVYSQASAQTIEPCPATPVTKPAASRSPAPVKSGSKASQTEINSSIADDPTVEAMISSYTEKVRALSVVIGTLDGDLKKGNIGAGTLGYFVTDAMKAQAKEKGITTVSMTIMNAGGLRKNEIAAGQLRASDIFELLPFENSLIALDLSGEQLSKILQTLTRDAQAGARIQYRWNEQNRSQVIDTKIVDSSGREHAVDPNATYTIVTIDYLYNLKSGTYAILQEAKNVRPLGIMLRDAVMNYIKAETAAGRSIKSRLDDRFVQIGPGPARQENPPQ